MGERYSVRMNSDNQADGYLLIDHRSMNEIAAIFDEEYFELAKKIAIMLNAEENKE